MQKILLVSPDVVGPKMAGPGIRYFEIAKQLHEWFDVTLCAPDFTGDLGVDFNVFIYEDLPSLAKYVADYDAVFAQSLSFEVAETALINGTRIIYDLYNPLPVEVLVGNVPKTAKQKAKKDRDYNELLNNLLLYSRTGSYFVCANERQRDFWTGFLAANRVFMPSRYGGQSIDHLIGLLPFGMQTNDPKHTKNVLRNILPGVDDNSFILLWTGGIWDWFDPLTAIKGVANLYSDYPNIKLVFLGTTHPNKLVGKMSMTDKAYNLAEELGVLNKSVFFIQGWVDYALRQNYLCEANLAISLHQNNLETRLAFRTRILDHYWAKLPSIVTVGDWFSEQITINNLGTSIDYGDTKGFEDTVISYYSNNKLSDEVRENISKVREGFKWSKIVSGDLKHFLDESADPNSQRAQTEAVDNSFINYYIDIASLPMLKKDSLQYQLLFSRINTYSRMSYSAKLKLMQKRSTKAFLLGEIDI